MQGLGTGVWMHVLCQSIHRTATLFCLSATKRQAASRTSRYRYSELHWCSVLADYAGIQLFGWGSMCLFRPNTYRREQGNRETPCSSLSCHLSVINIHRDNRAQLSLSQTSLKERAGIYCSVVLSNSFTETPHTRTSLRADPNMLGLGSLGMCFWNNDGTQ